MNNAISHAIAANTCTTNIILTIAVPNLPSGGDIAYAANSNSAVQHHATNGPYAVSNFVLDRIYKNISF